MANLRCTPDLAGGNRDRFAQCPFVSEKSDIFQHASCLLCAKSSDRGLLLQLGVNGFLVAMLVNAQLRMDIRLLEAAIGNPCVRALDSAFDQRVGL